MSKKRHWKTFVYKIRKTLRGDFVNLCSLWIVLRFFRDFNFSAILKYLFIVIFGCHDSSNSASDKYCSDI